MTTDDKKALPRVSTLLPDLDVIDTPASSERLREILQNSRSWAAFEPTRDHRERAWWDKNFE